MASGDELRTKAKEFERAQRFADALETYARLVEGASGGEAALLWQRIASIQERTGDVEVANESYSRAVELYVSSGQRNNALALCLGIAAKLPFDSPLALTTLRLALDLGYPDFARDAIEPVLLQAAQGNSSDEIVEEISAFLERHGRDPRCSPAELVERLPAAAEPQIAAVLRDVWRLLSASGPADIADRVRAEIIRIQPDADPAPTAARPSSVSDEIELAPSLPVIQTTTLPDEPAVFDVPRLEGLEPTHAGLDREREAPEVEDLPRANLPSGVVGRAPFSEDSAVEEAVGEEDLDDEEYEDEPLPLLIPTDRISAHDEPEARGWSPESELSFEVPDDTLEDLSEDTGFDVTIGRDADEPRLIPELDIRGISEELGRISNREVEPTDAASHYDVGVAFKEMGMTEDALARLAAALAGGHNPAATLEVIGEVLVDQNRHGEAARVLGFARTAGSEFDEGMAGVLYWLARSDEMLGKSEDARALFARVIRVAPSFRDASERLSDLPVQ